MIAAAAAGPASARREAAGRRRARAHPTPAAQRSFVDLLRPGDLVIANDAATLPASLRGTHVASGAEIEVRLAGRRSLAPDDVRKFSAIVFGERRFPHADRGPAAAAAARSRRSTLPRAAGGNRRSPCSDHPRLVSLALRRLARRDLGRASRGTAGRSSTRTCRRPLALWDVWTAIAGPPVAFEPPSAGFALDWQLLARDARARHRVRHDHACRRHLVDRR